MVKGEYLNGLRVPQEPWLSYDHLARQIGWAALEEPILQARKRWADKQPQFAEMREAFGAWTSEQMAGDPALQKQALFWEGGPFALEIKGADEYIGLVRKKHSADSLERVAGGMGEVAEDFSRRQRLIGQHGARPKETLVAAARLAHVINREILHPPVPILSVAFLANLTMAGKASRLERYQRRLQVMQTELEPWEEYRSEIQSSWQEAREDLETVTRYRLFSWVREDRTFGFEVGLLWPSRLEKVLSEAASGLRSKPSQPEAAMFLRRVTRDAARLGENGLGALVLWLQDLGLLVDEKGEDQSWQLSLYEAYKGDEEDLREVADSLALVVFSNWGQNGGKHNAFGNLCAKYVAADLISRWQEYGLPVKPYQVELPFIGGRVAAEPLKQGVEKEEFMAEVILPNGIHVDGASLIGGGFVLPGEQREGLTPGDWDDRMNKIAHVLEVLDNEGVGGLRKRSMHRDVLEVEFGGGKIRVTHSIRLGDDRLLLAIHQRGDHAYNVKLLKVEPRPTVYKGKKPKRKQH